MTDQRLTDRFEASRPRLRAIAARMLGSSAEADDAVQEAWLRADRAGTGGVDNVEGWLTTIVSRVCLDTLRSRTRAAARAERPEPAAVTVTVPGPEDDAVLADAFLAAARAGDFAALVDLLDPDAVFRPDAAAAAIGGDAVRVGAGAVAEAFAGRAQAARAAVLDGVLGVVVAPRGRVLLVLELAVEDGRIVEIDAVADPDRLAALGLAGGR